MSRSPSQLRVSLIKPSLSSFHFLIHPRHYTDQSLTFTSHRHSPDHSSRTQASSYIMEGAAVIAYAGVKEYWRRKNYHRLVNAKDLSIETQSQQLNKRRFRIRSRARSKLKLGRFSLRLGSIRKLFLKVRDAYVNAMLGIGISSTGYAGFVGGGSGGAKEYDEKMVVEIYKRIVLARQQGQGQSILAKKIGSDVTPVGLSV